MENLKQILNDNEFFLLFVNNNDDKLQKNIINLMQDNDIKIKESSYAQVNTYPSFDGVNTAPEISLSFDTFLGRVDFWKKIPQKEDNLIVYFNGMRYGKVYNLMMKTLASEEKLNRFNGDLKYTLVFLKNLYNSRKGENEKVNKIFMPRFSGFWSLGEDFSLGKTD